MRTVDRLILTLALDFTNANKSHLVTPPSPLPWMPTMNTQFDCRRRRTAAGVAAFLTAALFSLASPAKADEPRGFLETVKKHATLTSTVPENGDQNPYAIVVAPVCNTQRWVMFPFASSNCSALLSPRKVSVSWRMTC